MILDLFDKRIERSVLALLLQSPTHMRVLGLPLDSFAIKEHKELFRILRKYVKKYKGAPSIETLEIFANDLVTDDNVDQIVSALELGGKLPKIKKGEAVFYFEKLEDYRVGRGIYDLGTKIKESLEESTGSFSEIKEEIMRDVLSLGSSDEHIKRGFFTTEAEVRNRYQQYKDVTSGAGSSDVIPYGIKALDGTLGGMRKTFVTLLYSKTGGGKTRTMMNIAYNAAQAGYNVMYFTLEMSFDLIASCFDSRMAEVDSQKIIFGGLSKRDRKKYSQTLKKQMKEGVGIWLVDIPSNASMAKIAEEIEIYIGANGVSPDLIAIDYSHLVLPTIDAGDRSTKFDNLFKEIHEMSKYYNVATITAAPESSSKTRADAKVGQKKGEEVAEGTHNIGASNFMAFHCETVIRMKQDKVDLLRNRLYAIPDKNRYGKIGDPIELYADWATTLVCDPLNRIRKVPKKK